ncbi:hypothetical protein D3C73_544000 [compost metagenome]
MAKPMRAFGVLPETSAIDAGLKPEMVPLSRRSSSSCKGVCAKPISTMTRAMPKLERSSMILRPYLSASLPHSGWNRNEVMKFAAKISPAHNPSASPCTPRSLARYKVRNGVIMVIPALTRNWPNQSTMRLTFHVSQFFKVLSLPFKEFKVKSSRKKTFYQYIIDLERADATLVIVMSWDCHSLTGSAVVPNFQKEHNKG